MNNLFHSDGRNANQTLEGFIYQNKLTIENQAIIITKLTKMADELRADDKSDAFVQSRIDNANHIIQEAIEHNTKSYINETYYIVSEFRSNQVDFSVQLKLA